MIPDRNWWEQFASARLNLEVLLHQCGIALADEFVRNPRGAMHEARMLNFALKRAAKRAKRILAQRAVGALETRLNSESGHAGPGSTR